MTDMKDRIVRFRTWPAAMILAGTLFLPIIAPAQEEVASAFRRYKAYEASTGYYEEYEAKPRRQLPYVVSPGVKEGLFSYSPSAAVVRNRRHLADSHLGIEFYDRRRCEDCHAREARDIHTVRANLTCRQCHGGEPIASNDHYFSPMNPIRRHAYVCAKCHEGAGASFASYVVHAPNPAMAATRKEFPALFYVFWAMVAIAVGTFVVFLPHTGLWGIRELFLRKEKKGESGGKE
ncbi:MAG: hypothetical protein AB1427_11405 [Thermodesulfobacteriota bacterium]